MPLLGIKRHAQEDEIYRANIRRLIEPGTYTPPAHDFPAARYFPGALDPEDEEWENTKHLWDGWPDG